MGVKYDVEESIKFHSSMPNVTPIIARVVAMAPKTKNFMELWNINALWSISLVRFLHNSPGLWAVSP